MNKNLVFCTSISISLFATSAFALDLPQRKAGLWEMTVVNANPPTTTVMKQCIDEKTDAILQGNGTEMAKRMGGTCDKITMEKTKAGYQGETECQFAGSKMTTKTIVTGDLQATYNATIDSTFNPPFMGQSGGKTEVKGKWLGACEAGMTPGDVVMPNGMKMNVVQMTAAAGQAQQGQQGVTAEQIKKMSEEMNNKMQKQ